MEVDSSDEPQVIPMPSCHVCDSHVSDRFARVFSDENGRVWACTACSTNAGIAETAKKNRQRLSNQDV